jgi:hypothetical protein
MIIAYDELRFNTNSSNVITSDIIKQIIMRIEDKYIKILKN